MTWIPRPYQESAIDSVFDYWSTEGGSPLIVIPTGGGKAGVLGTVMRRIFDNYPDMRIVNLAHVAELVSQNEQELLGLWPWAPSGVYSAGLNRRESHAQILFASIQSVWNKAHQLGAIDLLIIDEAHCVPRKQTTTYVKFIKAARELNPDMRILGLTATPFRLDSGMLAEGEDKLFDDVCYEVSIRELIDEGYLTPLTSKATATALDTTGVAKRGGEFVAGALQAAVDKDDLNRAIVDEAIRYGHNRRSWLGFAAGVEHAHHLAEITRARGISAAVLDGKTPAGERKRMIADFKAMRIRALYNCGVLTTGFNAPAVDMIIAARPTESAGLYVQMMGRGTRNVYAPGMPLDTREQRLAAIAQGPKQNCLVLDFGGLVRRHGPVDMVQPKKPGKGGGDAPVKTCPECFSIVHASMMTCPDCGYEWERQLSDKITKTASAGPILSKSEPAWLDVKRRSFHRHEKFGGAPSVRVEYLCGLTLHKEWVSIEHASDGVRAMAKKWWRQNGGQMPEPESVDEALERAHELSPVESIRIEPKGKYFQVTGRKLGLGDNEDEVEKPLPPRPGAPMRGTYEYDRWLEEKDIPF